MTPAPITAHMSNFDPIPRLQQIAATIEDGGHFDSPATAAHYINCAIKEIERLREERDEARQMYCRAIPENCDEHEARKIAWERGWDCFREDKPCQ